MSTDNSNQPNDASLADRVSGGVGGILKGVHGGGEVLRGELTSGANLVTGNSPEAKNSDGQSIAGEGLNEFKRGLNEAISYPLGGHPNQTGQTGDSK